MITILAISALVLISAWVAGGLLLRLGGALLLVVGVSGIALLGDASGLLAAAIGALLWLAGHWHYALRHQEFKGPLARQIFSRWASAWLDPTRDWALAVDEQRRRRGRRERR